MSKLFNGAEREAKIRLRQQLDALPDVETSTMPLVDIREAMPVATPQAPARAPLPEVPHSEAPPAPVTRRRRRRPFRFLRRLVMLAVVALIGVVAFHWYGIERVDIPGGLAASTGTSTNILLVGTDSRAGLEPTDGADVYGLGIGGERTDTLLILNVSADGNRLLSIPRDLYVSSPATGVDQRINATRSNGADDLVAAVAQTLAIPIHHYAEVDFASFLGIVDAIGSVPVTLDHPAYDNRSGFRSDQAGTINLDADQSLAFVRSRSYVEVIDGVPTTDGSGDFGRTERQREYLRAMLDKLFAVRNPVDAFRVGAAVRDSLVVDDSTSIFDAIRLTLDLRDLGSSAQPVSSIVPVTPAVIDGADVLLLDTSRADAVLDTFRAPPEAG